MVKSRGFVAAVATVLLAASAGAVFARIYNGPALLQLIAGAAVLSVAISVALKRMSAAVAVLVSVLALAGYLLVAAALTRDPSAGGLGTVYFDALRNSGARILTSTFPVEPAPDTVFLPILVVWAAGLAGAEIAVRRGQVLIGFVPPAVAYGLALVFVGPNARPSVWLALAFLGVAAVATSLTREDASAEALRQLPAGQRAAYRGRGTAIGATALVMLLGVTVAVGTVVAQLREERPADPRTYVSPPEQEEPESNPLGRLSGWARQPDLPLFDVTMTSAKRIRWVVLNDYDGLNWTPEGRYRSAGSILPAPNAPGGRKTTKVRQQVMVTSLDGAWLPAVEQPQEIKGVRVSYDASTGTVLLPTGLKPGLRYETASEFVEAPDIAAVADAAVATGPAASRFLVVPPQAPEDIRKITDEVTGKTTRPYRKALAIEAHLSKQYRFVAEAPSGHGYANLEFFLDGSAEQGGKRGTSEQFASAFALMARMAGLPSRVVMGFHTGQVQGADTYQVRTGDAFAWPEVFFADHGWVAFDPTPAAGENTQRPPDEQTKEAEQQRQAKAQQLDAIEDEKAPDTDLAPIDPPTTRAEDGVSPAAWVAIAVGVVLLDIPLVLLFLRRGLRRRRLVDGTPGQRVVGAWWELLDALRLGGRRPAPYLAVEEVAAVAAEPVRGYDDPLPPVGELSGLVNMVAFAPGLADEAHAGMAAQVVTGYTAALRQRRSWWRRWLWSVDPRPLLWRRGRESVPLRPDVPRSGQDGVTPPSRRVQAESELASFSAETAAATTKQ